MNIEKNTYDLQQFLETILKIPEDKLFKDVHYHHMKIYIFMSEDENWKRFFEKNYKIENYGEIKKLVNSYTDRSGNESECTFYATTYPEKEVLIIMTGATEEAVFQTLERTANKSNNLVLAPIMPQLFQKLNRIVLDKYDGIKITEFKANRQPDLIDADIRPDIDRTIEYKGEDGRESLKEFKKYYGVVPSRIQYEHHHLAFKMDSVGKFTLKKINRPTFNLLLNLIEELVKETLEIKRVTEKIRFDTEIKRSGEKEIKIPNLTSGQISLSKPLNLYKVEEFMSIANDNEIRSFSFTDVNKQEGSLDFSARITDEERNAFFNLSATSNNITIIPKQNCNFPSIMEFYHLFKQHIDDQASIHLYTS